MAKPEKYIRRPASPVVRYALHLSNKDVPATKRSLSLLFTLASAGVLRARNANQLTFIFTEVEEVLSPEDTDFLEVRGHVTACRTSSVAGKPVTNTLTLAELIAEFEHLKGLAGASPTGSVPPCSFFFGANSDLPLLNHSLNVWETENC